MKIIVCNNLCIGQVVNYVKNHNYYYAIIQFNYEIYLFLAEFYPRDFCVVDHYTDEFSISNNKMLLPDAEYNFALYIKDVGMGLAGKTREDIRLEKKLKKNRYQFLAIKNTSNVLKHYKFVFPERKKVLNKTAVVIQHNGYGDNILVQVLLRMWLASSDMNRDHITFFHMYGEGMHIASLLLKDYRNEIYPLTDNFSHISDQRQDILLKELMVSNVINISNNLISSSYTKIREIKDMLEMESIESILDQPISFLALPQYIQDNILSLKKNKKIVIGVQFYTSHDTETYINRSYSQVLAQQLIDICRQNHFGVINLSKYGQQSLDADIDTEDLSVNELFSVINQVDMVIGIDSCCAHIAGVLKKKNLVLLGREIHNVTQRPISMNYTLISLEGDINKIKPHDVYKVAVKMLHGEIKVCNKIKEKYDYSYDVDFI